jgi:hypothetical protein
MSDDPVSALLMIVFNVSVGSIPIILVVIVLKALFREYGATVVNASRTAKKIVMTQSDRAKTAFEVRKAEQELDRLLKLRDTGVVNEEEFQKKSARVRGILRKQLID